MKTNYFTLALIAILLSFNIVQAKSKVLLRLNLKKGTTYEMTMISDNLIDQEIMGQEMKITQKMEMVFSYHVTDVLPSNNFEIEYSVQKMKLNMNINGQDVNMDSESTDDSNPGNKSLKDLVNIKIKMEVTPKGSIQKVEGLDEYAQKLSGNQQMAQSMQMFLNKDNFESFVGQTLNYFPEEAVEKGTKWTSTYKLPSMMNMETTMNFEVASIDKKNILLNVVSDINMNMPIEQNGMTIDMKMTGTQNGTMSISPIDGWVRGSDLTQKFDMIMKMNNPQSGEDMEIPMKMNAVTKITVVEK